MFRAVGGFALLVLLSAVAQAKTIELLIPANVAWFDTGVVVGKGQRISVAASGLWSNGGLEEAYTGPAGFMHVIRQDTIFPSAPLAALVGRVGHTIVPIGAYTELALEGRLFLTMNDVPNTYGDNSGYMAVTIKILPR